MEDNKSSWLVPVAIVACLLMIAGAVYYKDAGRPAKDSTAWPTGLDKIIEKPEGIDISAFPVINSSDKIRGSADAPLKLVVYTDLECPACKYYHQQLKGLEETYVKTGKLALVMRNFPLDSLHAKARQEHLAVECVAGLGGQDKYWQVVDKIFEVTTSNDGLDLAKLPEMAKEAGINEKDFQACMDAKKYADDIEADVQEAIKMGAKGTPFSVLVGKDIIIPVYGAYPAERLKSALDLLLAPKEEVKTEDTATTTATNPATTTKK